MIDLFISLRPFYRHLKLLNLSIINQFKFGMSKNGVIFFYVKKSYRQTNRQKFQKLRTTAPAATVEIGSIIYTPGPIFDLVSIILCVRA